MAMSCLLSEQTIGAQLIFPLRSDVFSASQSFPEALGILSEQSCAIWAFGAPRRSVSFVGKVPSFIFFRGKEIRYSGGTSGKEPSCQYRRLKRCRFDPWVGKIPWRRARQPTPVFLPGESHEQRSLVAAVHRVTQSWMLLN